jgi:alanine racemase
MSDFQFSITAGETLEPGRIVGFNGQYADNNDVSPAGITSGYAESGEVTTLVNGGLYVCDSDGAIAVGVLVMATTDGKVTSAAAVTDTAWILGQAFKAASGGKVLVMYRPFYIPAPAP